MSFNDVFRQRFGQIILASASLRRAEILRQVGFDFRVVPSRIEETFSDSDPVAMAKILAYKKAKEVSSQFPEAIVLGADTIVYLDHEMLGKPENVTDAFRMLRLLSGKCHRVVTAVALIRQNSEKEAVEVENTEVKFRELSNEEIENYVDSGAPFDKAGAYGIQDQSALFVEKINGDFYNVVGLPIAKVYSALYRVF
jgi:septum formation protein